MKTAIEMARKAVNYSPETEYFPILHTKEQIERFAALVAEAKDKEIAAKQAEIDRLMLEFCPQEMTPEQVANWEAHQQPWSDK